MDNLPFPEDPTDPSHMTQAEFLRWAAGVPTAVWAILGFEESRAMDVVEFVPPDEFPLLERVILN